MASLDEVHHAISGIFDAQRRSAERSDYDRRVCILAVSAAALKWQEIEVAGSPSMYLRSILTALEILRDSYYDPDGEYTSGCSEIGSIVAKIERLQSALPRSCET